MENIPCQQSKYGVNSSILLRVVCIEHEPYRYLREPLGMTNRHVGYVYLVDEQCRIRWAGCADAKPEEAEALRSCTGVLLARHTKAQESFS